jgi:hypothetical protein
MPQAPGYGTTVLGLAARGLAIPLRPRSQPAETHVKITYCGFRRTLGCSPWTPH